VSYRLEELVLAPEQIGIMKKFIEWIEEELRSRRITRSQLAEGVGCSTKTLYNWMVADKSFSPEGARSIYYYLKEREVPFEVLAREFEIPVRGRPSGFTGDELEGMPRRETGPAADDPVAGEPLAERTAELVRDSSFSFWEYTRAARKTHSTRGRSQRELFNQFVLGAYASLGAGDLVATFCQDVRPWTLEPSELPVLGAELSSALGRGASFYYASPSEGLTIKMARAGLTSTLHEHVLESDVQRLREFAHERLKSEEGSSEASSGRVKHLRMETETFLAPGHVYTLLCARDRQGRPIRRAYLRLFARDVRGQRDQLWDLDEVQTEFMFFYLSQQVKEHCDGVDIAVEHVLAGGHGGQPWRAGTLGGAHDPDR
jgi:transcriptional regulator with XRE-family HTH domain